MIWYKPDNIIFKNRKEAKKYFGANKYYKIEQEKNGNNQTDINK